MIKIICALDNNHFIGYKNDLIYKIKKDLKRFKDLTTGNYIVMGRKTWDSMGNKPLKNRNNIVVSSNEENIKGDGYIYANSLETALKITSNDCFIIGGAEIYKQALKIADKMYLTWINNHNSYGDVQFPDINYLEWGLVSKSEVFTEDDITFNFSDYERRM